MKKISLLDNETFSIKGALGEVYVFDGEDLFVDPVGLMGSKKATVIKSLRTERGAKDWVKLAGSKFGEKVEVLDTDTLKANFEDVDGLEDEELPFHVVIADDDDDDDLNDFEDEMRDDMDDPVDEDDFEDGEMARTQISQILEDAKELYNLVDSMADLEPWVQSKLTRAADYMNTLSEYLDHSEEAQEKLGRDEDDGDDEDPMEEMIEDEVEEEMREENDDDETQKGKMKNKWVDEGRGKSGGGSSDDGGPGPGEHPEDEKGEKTYGDSSSGDENDEKKAVPAEPAMMSTNEEEGEEKGPTHADMFDDAVGKRVQMTRTNSSGEEVTETGKVVKNEDGTAMVNTGSGIKKFKHDGGNHSKISDINILEEKSVVGTVFKSLHAARQWNKFDNPDKDRYYIDIMRSTDFDNPWDRTRNLNAKYVVRDMADKELTQKGAYGNRKVSRTTNLPEKTIDSGTREVAALGEPESVPEDSVGD